MDALEENTQDSESISNNTQSKSALIKSPQKPPIKETWTYHHEKIFIEWADKAMCYRWLHNSAHIDYKCYNTWFTIPVICISTITGTANFAQERFEDDMRSLVQIVIGTFNIIAAILTTIQQFLKISELNEAHRVSSLLWGKFYRDIKVEMAKSPHERKSPTTLLKHCKNEYDRLMEISPIIPDRTIQNFKDTFSGKKKSKSWNTKCRMLCCNGYVCCEKEEKTQYMLQEFDDDNLTSTPSSTKIKKLSQKEKIDAMKAAFEKIHKPEICDELVSTEETRFKLAPNEKLESGPTQYELELIELKKNAEITSNNFVEDFAELNGREPTYIEYLDGVHNKNISDEFISRELYKKSIKELKGPVMA